MHDEEELHVRRSPKHPHPTLLKRRCHTLSPTALRSVYPGRRSQRSAALFEDISSWTPSLSSIAAMCASMRTQCKEKSKHFLAALASLNVQAAFPSVLCDRLHIVLKQARLALELRRLVRANHVGTQVWTFFFSQARLAFRAESGLAQRCLPIGHSRRLRRATRSASSQMSPP